MLDNCIKTLYIIFQKPAGYLCKVESKQTSRTMLSVAENLPDKSFHICLNTITQDDDEIAYDVRYHNLCWAKGKKKPEPKVELANNHVKTLADIELINYIQTKIFHNPDIVLDMNFLNLPYHAILVENGVESKDL